MPRQFCFHPSSQISLVCILANLAKAAGSMGPSRLCMLGLGISLLMVPALALAQGAEIETAVASSLATSTETDLLSPRDETSNGELSVQESSSRQPSQMDLLDAERILEVGDRLVYQVQEEREPPTSLFVDDRGEVQVPLIGRIKATGLTCRQLAYQIRDELEKDFFHRATVIIRFQFADRSRGRVTVLGEVREPGRLPIPTDEVITVSAAILRAGGFLTGADSSKVVLVRRNPDNPDEETRETFDVGTMLRSGDFSADPTIEPGDLLLVPKLEAAGGFVYVEGAVNKPGLYPIPPEGGLSVSRAILLAGGFNRFARDNKVKLVRGDEGLEESERTQFIDVASILEEGRWENDVTVRDNDIIRVEERLINFR